MDKLRYALIGCGRRSGTHIHVVDQLRETFDIVAVCDADAVAVQQAAAQLKTKAYTDVREMVAAETLDLCDVVVPAELHHAISCYLSSHGIHQNIETSLAPTLGLMDLMIETAQANNVKLQTSENFPFLPLEQFVRKLLQADVIGPVHKSYRFFSTTGYHGLAAMRARMGSKPVSVSSICHTMPVTPYVDRAKRDWTTESLEFTSVDYEGGGLGIALVGNKNGCLGRNGLVGFETLGERGTIITNGNQGATGGETVNVCTEEDIAKRAAAARTYYIQRSTTEAGALARMWVELPTSLGGTMDWVNPYQDTTITETNISVATLLEGLAAAIRDNGDVLWPGVNGRADQEMVIAARRSCAANRQPVALPLLADPGEEAAFDEAFTARFGVHPRADIEAVLGVSFKAR